MREILFRGKLEDNGEWVYGAFCPKSCDLPFGPMVDRPSIIKLEDPCSGYWADVIPDTVGQYTGLIDRNGKKIFEGDIVQAHFRNNHSKQIFRVAFDDGMFLFDNSCVKVPKYDIYAMEVIGNIHDNPELLRGTNND